MKNQVDFYEIYDYYYVPFYKTTYFTIAMIILALAVVAVALYFVTKYFLRKKLEKELAADFWALKELKRLSVESCVTKDDLKKFYFDLTCVIKVYLHKRYGWLTQDKTDEELITYLEDKKFNVSLLDSLRHFANEALWVKFADQDALKMQAQKDLDMVYQIVRDTSERFDRK